MLKVGGGGERRRERWNEKQYRILNRNDKGGVRPITGLHSLESLE